MKIDLSKIDKENFNIKENYIAGELCYLIYPKELGVSWTQENKIFRSSIWNSNGELVSAGLPKFPNFLEKPDIFPVPTDIKTARIISKEDGSCLILSKYKNENIIRTRGSFSLNHLENFNEIELLKQKYPLVFNFYNNVAPTCNFSWLFEWVSPTNKICLGYSEPDLYLIGGISHENYELFTQDYLDSLAKSIGVKRPDDYKFSNIPELLNTIKEIKGKEGVVLYTNNGQTLHKIKSDFYLKLHYFKSTCNLNSLLDLYFEWDYPDIPTFCDKIEREFDFECLEMAKPLLNQIKLAVVRVMNKIIKLDCIKNENKHLLQKEYAELVLTKHKEDSTFLFQLRAKGELDKKNLRKLLERELTK